MASYRARYAKDWIAAGADIVPALFEDAADRAVDLLCGAPDKERIVIPPTETKEEQAFLVSRSA